MPLVTCRFARPMRRLLLLSLATWGFASATACGDVAQQSEGTLACDSSYCVDCADPCCYDLGYC